VGYPAPEQTQWCRVCGYDLDLTCFGLKYPDRSLLRRICRVCAREQSRKYYLLDPAPYKARAKAGRKRARRRNREKLREYLRTQCCLDCGIGDFAVLEFDHRDPREKRCNVSSLAVQPVSWAAVLCEIEKCDVVCANCHRRRTARYFGWRKLLGLKQLVLPLLPKRGTPTYERIKWTRSQLARQHRNRAHLYEYLGEHPCERCREDDPVVLDFDHLRDKRRHVTDIARSGGWSDLLAEIEKCRVLCANCHRRETATSAGRDR
jgi:hypothetical protein